MTVHLERKSIQKTQGFLMGKLRYAKDTLLDIRWTYDKIKT